MTTATDIVKKVDQLEKIIVEKAASQRPPAGQFLTGQHSWRQHDKDDWPEKDLERLKAYDEHDVRCLMAYGPRQRLTGLGPYLCKVAGFAAASVSHQGTLSLLKKQGLWEDGYSLEKFYSDFKTDSVNSYAIYKSLDGREVRKAALAEGSGQTGGYIVPPQFMNELLTIGAEDAFIEPRAKVVPMTSRTAQWPTLDITTAQAAGTSPYFGGILGQWQPEAATINESEPAFRQTEWVAWDLVLYSVSSNQLLADNGIGLDALLTQLFGQAMTWYKEYAYLQGKGAGSTMPLGVLNSPATLAVSRAVANKFKFADAATMMSKLQVRSWDDATWVMHQSVLPELLQMASGAVANTASTTYIPGNTLMWQPTLGSGELGPAAMKMPKVFLNGLPVFFTEKVPQLGTKGDVMLVDWSRYVIGMRLDYQIDVSPHYLFRNNQLAWRVVARVDGKPWLNNVITDASGFTSSPFVVLN